MLDCIVLGDSIAVGTANQLPGCVSYSRSGINSQQWNHRYGRRDLAARTVVISLGTNDHGQVRTREELTKLRARVQAESVTWILPPCNKNFCRPQVNQWIQEIAVEHGDRIIATQRLAPDHVHPTLAGYRELAEKTR